MSVVNNQLQTLVRHQAEILLAEAIGWLHDYRKCSDEHLRVQAAKLTGQQALPRNSLVQQQQYRTLNNVQIQLVGCVRRVADLLDDSTWNRDILGQYLRRCHNTAHFDKQEPVGGKQIYPDMKLSTPFGFEKGIPNNLTSQLWGLPWNNLISYSSRQTLRAAISLLFSQTVADTRRPINEVDLWGWGLLVGALYKSALAGALLTGQISQPPDLRWRLLGVQVNGLDYFLNVSRIPDLLARQELLSQALDQVRELLEVTYPLGSEVYRDENGAIFVVPDLLNLLDIEDNNGTSLKDLILSAFAGNNNSQSSVNGEVVPQLTLEKQAWWGQDPNWPNSSNDEIPEIAAFLGVPASHSVNISEIESAWNTKYAEVCTVCGLRPQGSNPKAWERKVCDVCEQRRTNRSKTWVNEQLDRTIWIDEVADTSARLALIACTFDLTHWLDGSLSRSLLLVAPYDPQNTKGQPVTSKTPSFSRLRRIWETTRSFWQEVQQELLRQLIDDRRRLQIYLDQPASLGDFHVYDLMLGMTDLSVVWIPPQLNADGYLLSADNLGTIARRLGAEQAVYNHPASAAIFVEDYINDNFVKQGRTPSLYNPENNGNRANLLNGFQIRQIQYQQDTYATIIPLLAEPRVFMALVPADKALEIIRQIKTKYEREMGKVRNRLPLHLGVVFAPRPTPLRVVLDAGRAMLERQTVAGVWEVLCCARKMVSQGDSLPPRFQPDQAGQFAEWYEVTLQRDDQRLTWHIPALMGDGQTEDLWYPYVFLDDPTEPTTRKRYFKSRNPWKGCDGWLVHADELQVGDRVWFTPATFDFEFLDTTTRRFEIHYDTNGRRTNRRTRPFYIDDLERFDRLWEVFLCLSTTQRHQVVRTLEVTREEWFARDRNGTSVTDPVFKQFVHDTLAGAGWDWKALPQHIRDQFVAAGVRGELADLLELRMEILKEE